MTTACAVQRCPREGTWPVRLKEAGEEISARSRSGTFIAVPACTEHRELLMNASVEWILEIGKDPLNPRWHQQTLMLGGDLGPLDEFILTEKPTLKERPDLYSRIFSEVAHDGLHVNLELRRRGSEGSEMKTIVVPPSMIEGLVELLRASLPREDNH